MEQISFLTPAVYQTTPDNRQVSTEPISYCPSDYMSKHTHQFFFPKKSGMCIFLKEEFSGKSKRKAA